ncbi:MAG: phospholipase D-like domain-containing protein [Nocardioides sp.]
MRRLTAVTVLASSLLLAGTLGTFPSTAAPGVTAATAQGHGLPRPVSTAVERATTGTGAKPAPDHYTPTPGVKFNNPLGDKPHRREIVNHLLRSINSVPGRGQIRIATWNFRSGEIADALIAANRRGVSVRVVIDRLNANTDNPNPPFERLTAALKHHDSNRRKDMTSFTRECVSSCRAPGGIAHVKFYLFSQAGKAHDVVEYGSFNATDLATRSQWNDLYTYRNKTAMYGEFLGVFDQMRKDRNVKQPYLHYTHGRETSYFYPYKGKGTTKADGSLRDPMLTELNKIVCKGATNGAGTAGYTRLRFAQTSMHGDRGKALAERIRQMWERGCDIKMDYAVFGNEVLSILRHTSRGPVPIKQIAQDFDKDGVYDRYLHMKTLAVSGVYDGRTDAHVTWNGSANYTSVALASDEVVVRIFDPRVEGAYATWFDYLFNNPPPNSGNPGTSPEVRTAVRRNVATGIDPYAKMQLD